MSNEANQGSPRRRTVLAAGVGVGVLAAGGLGYVIFDGARRRGTSRHAPPAADARVGALFGELREGARVDHWTIVRLHGVHFGAIPVIMRDADGSQFQVDVLRRDPAGPAGVGNTPSLSLYVSNAGDGGTGTEESQGLGAIALADALAERERAGAPVPRLMTLRERLEAHPDAVFAVTM